MNEIILRTPKTEYCPACGCPTHAGITVKSDRGLVYTSNMNAEYKAMSDLYNNKDFVSMLVTCYRCDYNWVEEVEKYITIKN